MKSKIKIVFLGLLLVQMGFAQISLFSTLADAQNANSNSNANAAPAPVNTGPAYSGPEATIRKYLCAPTDVSNAPTTNTPGVGTTAASNPAAEELPNCINRLYRFAVALGAIAGVFFIVLAGYYYMLGSESGKERGKELIISVFVGMLILFGSYVLLRQINPTLVTFRQIQPPTLADPGTYPSCADVGLGQNCTLADGSRGVGNGQGGGYSTKSCGPIQNQGSGCDVNKLASACNWNGTQASQICNHESGGGMTPAIGGTADYCYPDGPDGRKLPMSIGYFQINIFNSFSPEFTRECSGVLNNDGCWVPKVQLKDSGLFYCPKRKCSFDPKGESGYNACVQALSNGDRNTKQACNLYHSNGNKFGPTTWSSAQVCNVP